MTDDPRDPLIEAALTATEGGEVDWDQVRALVPEEPDTVTQLAALAEVFAANGEPPDDGGPEPTDGAAHASQDFRPFRWGPLEVRARIAEGTFGEVFLAWDPRLQRDVALKLRRAGASERSRRWLDEARRLARVRHPNVVAVHGADMHDGRVGIWMERVHGLTLEQRLRRDGPLGPREAALVGLELCGALAAVHAAGLVHGDVKTHNVVREGAPGRARDAGRIVLMDFGSAHASGDTGRPPGTPLFTAPEVLEGGQVTPASDVWSLGVVLYRLVTGAWPYEAATLDELRRVVASDGAVPLRARRSELPVAFVTAVERALERDPARRWSDSVALERALLPALGAGERAEHWISRHHARRRRRRIALALGTLALVALGAWAGITRGPAAWMAWRTRAHLLTGELAAERFGPAVNAELGSWVVNLGDVNGDGREDVAVAAASAMNGTGQLQLFTPGTGDSLTPFLTLHGEAPGDLFGSVAAGDLNGDGYRDIVVSAVEHDGIARDAGRVYVYFGGPGLDSIPDRVIDGTHAAQYFGYGVSCGDVNGDRIDDLIVGAPYDQKSGPASGRAWVFFGGHGFDTTPDLELASGVAGSNFGLTVAAIGDWNGDGYGDFVVGAPQDPGGGRRRGAAYVYFGGPKVDDRADVVLRGPDDDGSFGVVRQPAGDVNGDGFPDLVVTAESGRGFEPHAGAVYVYDGGPDADGEPDLVLRGERRGDGFGVWADGSRDLDGDGCADVFVGAPWHDMHGAPAAGRGYVFLGGRHMDDVPDWSVDGTVEQGWLGFSGCFVRGVGRGFGTMMLGAKHDSRGLIQAGAVQRYDVGRWLVQPPRAGDGWAAGRRATLRWSGESRADVSLSTDGGRTWTPVAHRAGGRPHDVLPVPVPASARGELHVRLTGADRNPWGAVTVRIPLPEAGARIR